MSVNQTAFRLQTEESESGITVSFPADTALTESNAEELQRGLLALVAGRTHPNLIVDLSGITILTSIILSKFIAINRNVRDAGGHLTLLNPTPTVRMVFTVTRLDALLDIKPAASGMPA